MRILVLAAVLAAIGAVGAKADQSRHHRGPWCMIMIAADDVIEKQCDIPSYEVCREQMMGLSSASCVQNPYYYARYDRESPLGFRWHWR